MQEQMITVGSWGQPHSWDISSRVVKSRSWDCVTERNKQKHLSNSVMLLLLYCQPALNTDTLPKRTSHRHEELSAVIEGLNAKAPGFEHLVRRPWCYVGRLWQLYDLEQVTRFS